MVEVKKSFIPRVDPPLQVLRGFSDGCSQLDPRAWLEVLDPKHRYAKNLRSYFQAWDLLNKPGNDFLSWLDHGGYELDVCPRRELESDTVHYCQRGEREKFALKITRRGRFIDKDGQLVTTGDAGWIFVLRDGILYAAEKRTRAPRFHHSSFFAGECVDVAGMFVITEGVLKRFFPHSGHYRPGDKHIQLLLRFLQKSNVNIGSIEVDAQHTMKVARLLRKEGNRVKKKDRPHLMRGDALLHFLERKHSAWSTPLFSELSERQKLIQERRQLAASQDSEASTDVDDVSHVDDPLEPTESEHFDYHTTVSHTAREKPSVRSIFNLDMETPGGFGHAARRATYDPVGWAESPPSPRVGALATFPDSKQTGLLSEYFESLDLDVDADDIHAS